MSPLHLLLGILLLSISGARAQQEWSTTYDRSEGTRTPGYDKTVDYCRRLASHSPGAMYTTFGVSPQGRALPLLIVSKAKAFTPEAAARSRQAVVLIQAGIHSGEIDGKDAMFTVLREMLVQQQDTEILDSVIILFVPIFSVDGHERSRPFNRINQNGPAEMGWRTTVRNLNLNRDYMKADGPEMRAMLTLFRQWLPDLFEPRSGDSFVAWGFFNAIFEQKEYAEDYVMEKEGKAMLDADPSLRAEFTAKVAADSAFARDPNARLNWLSNRSRWADERLNMYPVGRIDATTLQGLQLR